MNSGNVVNSNIVSDTPNPPIKISITHIISILKAQRWWLQLCGAYGYVGAEQGR